MEAGESEVHCACQLEFEAILGCMGAYLKTTTNIKNLIVTLLSFLFLNCGRLQQFPILSFQVTQQGTNDVPNTHKP